MGIISRALGLTRPITAGAVSTKRVSLASPTSGGALEQIVYADVFGTTAMPVTRAEAMTVPPISNARFLIAPTLGRHPLVVKDSNGDVLPEQPAWLQSTAGALAPQLRMVWTLDDLMFTGFSLWMVERGEDGLPTSAERVPAETWDFDAEGRVVVDSAEVTAAEAIVFVSVMDPLLDVAARTIRGARALEEAWTKRVKDPIPLMEISQDVEDAATDWDPDLDEDDPDRDDADDDDFGKQLVRAYLGARRAPDTSQVVFSPYGYSLKAHGEAKTDLFVEGRNAAVLDVARFVALPPALLGASQVSASLTYSTKEGSRSEFHDYSLANWALAITARLSMDDCVAPGHSVDFDLTALLSDPTPPTGPTRED